VTNADDDEKRRGRVSGAVNERGVLVGLSAGAGEACRYRQLDPIVRGILRRFFALVDREDELFKSFFRRPVWI